MHRLAPQLRRTSIVTIGDTITMFDNLRHLKFDYENSLQVFQACARRRCLPNLEILEIDLYRLASESAQLKLLYDPELLFPKLHTLTIEAGFIQGVDTDAAVSLGKQQLLHFLKAHAEFGANSLRSLKIAGSILSPACMEVLCSQFATSLLKLEIHSPQVVDHICQLPRLTRLRTLYLPGSPRRSAADLWRAVSSLPNLSEVALFHAKSEREVQFSEQAPFSDRELQWPVHYLPSMAI